MLFSKKIEPSCSYCRNGSQINDTQVACLKKGIVSSGGRCGKFKYDPLRREPPHPVEVKTEGLSAEDFEL